MLLELAIRNFAIIDDLRIRFGNGLTIMSGETGAGKSIVIQAVDLLLGGRAKATIIRAGAEHAELEALFAVPAGSSTARAMAEQGFDPEAELLVRRKVSLSGRHRIYINDRLATVQALRAISANLASISGQHAHQGLLSEERHLLVLDQFGGLMDLRRSVQSQYRSLLPLLSERERLLEIEQGRSEHYNLLRFERNEIRDAQLKDAEDEQLQVERRRLKNAEQLYQMVYETIDTLYGAQGAATERLAAARTALATGADIDPKLGDALSRLEAAAYAVEDISSELQTYLNTIRIDTKALEAVEERIDLLTKLKRKYGPTLDDVCAHLKRAEQELGKVADIAETLSQMDSQIDTALSGLIETSRTLSARRQKAATHLARQVEKELAGLKMARTRFEVDLRPHSAGGQNIPEVDGSPVEETGLDRATFLIAPNVGEALKPLADIASGGELSRVVLALKTILAATEAVETIIFDEVDAGIGGGVAEGVGAKLAQLAKHHQVVCITHLPQIAKFGDQHLRIRKQVIDKRTVTIIEPLTASARVEEIARMLGGEKISATTRKHALELLRR